MIELSAFDKYLVPVVAALVFQFILILGFILFSDVPDQGEFALRQGLKDTGTSWTGEPILPPIEKGFRPLRPY